VGKKELVNKNESWMGEYVHALDEKNRLFIPSRLREGVKRKFIMTRGLESCLYLYAESTFSLMAQKLENIPLRQKGDVRAVKRFFLSGASETVVDPMGRILVPNHMSKSVGLKRKCAILGVGNRIEIWDEGRWGKYRRQAESSFRRLSSQFEL